MKQQTPTTRDWYIAREFIKLGVCHPTYSNQDLIGTTMAQEIFENAPSGEDEIESDMNDVWYDDEQKTQPSTDGLSEREEKIGGLVPCKFCPKMHPVGYMCMSAPPPPDTSKLELPNNPAYLRGELSEQDKEINFRGREIKRLEISNNKLRLDRDLFKTKIERLEAEELAAYRGTCGKNIYGRAIDKYIFCPYCGGKIVEVTE